MAPPVEERRAIVRALLAKSRAADAGLGQRRNAAARKYNKKYGLTKKEWKAEAAARKERANNGPDIGGTLVGALEDLGKGALTVLDTPRRAMMAATMGTAGVLAEGVEALGIKDYETDFFKKAGKAISGDYSGADFLEDVGVGEDVAKWGGLAYDIFADPLTYAAPYAKFAGGAKKTSQVLEESLSATLQAARKRGGLTAAEEATRTSGQAAIAALRKRGGFANLSRKQTAEHFGKEAWNRGIGLTVPGTGRWAKRLGSPFAKNGPIQAPFVPRSVTNKVMGPLNRGATSITRSGKMAGIMDKLSSQTELGRGFTKEAQSGDPILAARGVSGEVGESAAHAASRTATQDLIDEYTPISEIIKANHENPADVIKAIETGRVEGVAGAKELQEWFVKAAVVAREFGVQVNELAQYFPRQIRKELVNRIKLNPTQRRRLVAGAVGPDGKKLVGDASEIRKVLDDWAKEKGYPAGYFNDNPDEVIPKYLEALQKKMIQGRTMQHLGRGGHIDYVGKGLDEVAQLALGPGRTPLALNAGEEILDGGPGPIPDSGVPGGYRNIGGRDVSGQQFQPPLPGGGPIPMPPGRQPFAMPPVGAGDDVIEAASRVLPNPTYGPDGPIHGPYDPIEEAAKPLTRQQQVAKAGAEARSQSHLAVRDALEARYPGGWKAAAADPEANLVERAVAARAISIEQSSTGRVGSDAFIKVDRGWTLNPELFPGSEGLVGLPAVNKYLDDTVSGAGLRPYAGTAKAEAKEAGAHLRGALAKLHRGLTRNAQAQAMRGITANVGDEARVATAVRAFDEITSTMAPLRKLEMDGADLATLAAKRNEINNTGVVNAMHGGPIPEHLRAPHEPGSGQVEMLAAQREGFGPDYRRFHNADVGEVTFQGPGRFKVRGLDELSNRPIHNADGAIVGYEDGVDLETLRARLEMYIETARKKGVAAPSITGTGIADPRTQAMIDALEGRVPTGGPQGTSTFAQRTMKEFDAENEARFEALLGERGRLPGPDGEPASVSPVWDDLRGERPVEGIHALTEELAARTNAARLDDGSIVIAVKPKDLLGPDLGGSKAQAKIRKGDIYLVDNPRPGSPQGIEQVVPNDKVFKPEYHSTEKLREIIHRQTVERAVYEPDALSKYPALDEAEVDDTLFRQKFPDYQEGNLQDDLYMAGYGVPSKNKSALTEEYDDLFAAAEEAAAYKVRAAAAKADAEMLASGRPQGNLNSEVKLSFQEPQAAWSDPLRTAEEQKRVDAALAQRAQRRAKKEADSGIGTKESIQQKMDEANAEIRGEYTTATEDDYDAAAELAAATDAFEAAAKAEVKAREAIFKRAFDDGLIRHGSDPGDLIEEGSSGWKYVRSETSPDEDRLIGGAQYLAERWGVNPKELIDIEPNYVVKAGKPVPNATVVNLDEFPGTVVGMDDLDIATGGTGRGTRVSPEVEALRSRIGPWEAEGRTPRVGDDLVGGEQFGMPVEPLNRARPNAGSNWRKKNPGAATPTPDVPNVSGVTYGPPTPPKNLFPAPELGPPPTREVPIFASPAEKKLRDVLDSIERNASYNARGTRDYPWESPLGDMPSSGIAANNPWPSGRAGGAKGDFVATEGSAFPARIGTETVGGGTPGKFAVLDPDTGKVVSGPFPTLQQANDALETAATGSTRFVGTRMKPNFRRIAELHHKEWVEDTVDAWNVAELARPRALGVGDPAPLALGAGPRQAIPMPPGPGAKSAIPMPPGPDVRPRLGAGKGLDEPVRTLRWTDGEYARALSRQPEALGRAAESMRTRIGVSQTHLQSLVDSNASVAKVSGVAEGLMSDKRAMKMLEAAAEETDPDLAHVAVLEAQAEMALGDAARKSGAYRKKAADTAPPTFVSDHAFQAGVDGGLRETLGALGRSDLAAAPGLAEIFTAVSKVRAPGAGTRFLKHYDQLLRYTKAWQTATPGFHVRNGMGGAFNNWIADIDIGAYRAYRRAKKEWIRLTDDGAKALPTTASDEVVMFDKWHSVRSRGQYSADEVALGQHHTKGSWAPWKSDNKITRGSQDAGTWTEDYLRGALAMDRMRKGQSLELALQDVYKYHFDYGSLSQFERQYVKRVIPFYTWTRKNFPLQLEMMAKRPGKYANAMKVREAISAEQRDIMPSWFADSWASPLGITSGDLPFGSGNDQMFLTPDLPFTQTMTGPLPLGPNGVDFKRPLGMVTPLLKVPAELMTGQKFYANQGFDKERVVGGDGPGLHGGLDNVPGLLPILKQLGVAKTAKKSDKYGRWEKGDTMLPERVAYTLESFIPLMAQTQRLTPAEPGKQDRALGTFLSFLGFPLRANTERDQDLARYFGGREP